jgi:hypothetical protein
VAIFNDNQAKINSSGNLSLGQYGLDDGAGDSSHPYAKDDLWVQFDVLNLRGIPTTSLTMSDVRTAVGQYGRVFTSGGAITPKVPVYIPNLYRTLNQYLDGRNASQPHGFKLRAMYLSYTIATADATSIAVVFTTESAQSNSTARANSSTTPLGTVTYENPPGTVVGTLPVGQDADPLVNKIVPGTPAFITTERDILTAELQLSLPNTCVLTITELSFNFAMALY